MKKALIIVLIVVAVLVVAGIAAFLYADSRIKAYVEEEAETRIASRVPQADGIDVTIEGFPLLWDVLFGAKIEGLNVVVARVQSHGIQAGCAPCSFWVMVTGWDGSENDYDLAMALQ